MSDKVTNQLLLEHLKAIQSKLSSMANDVSDLKSDMREPQAANDGIPLPQTAPTTTE